ncbi:hypothetical protein SBOR_6943 [Sclerotinia borealis F-4128]|uniref:HAD superfamily hydrolase n=1 Tax=Sclerotinia borealis (strain F-4128) TaxID=1432307 RepID=W9C7E0_SCLBF|nr:hypothetical protein SBOR_6943 [Sclerotinia borealis F-4128]
MNIRPNHFSPILKFASKSILGRKSRFACTSTSITLPTPSITLRTRTTRTSKGSLRGIGSGSGSGSGCKRAFGMTTRVAEISGGGGGGTGGGIRENEGVEVGVRRFAPLGDVEDGEGKGVRRLRGIIFDMDGTLCEPQTYMYVQFGQMRNALGIDKTIDILDHIYSLPSSDQDAAHERIRAIEREAMLTQVPQPGLQTLFTYLRTHTLTLPLAILTRNHPPPVQHLLATHLPHTPFFPIITREFRPPKPHPAGILHIAEEWNVDPRDTIMVGDSIDDMKAGFAAGAATVLLGNSVNRELWEHECTDLVVERLDELVDILKGGFVGRVER